MAANDRNNPVSIARHLDSDLSVVEFWREYPDDAACLDGSGAALRAGWPSRALPGLRAGAEVPPHQDAGLLCLRFLQKHLHPMKGTIFEKSTTSLQLWFYAMFLMASTRCGISAKQLERELGVTYKTAWRMFNKIRTELMTDDGEAS